MARIWVVEDDPTIGGALETSLRTHGHDVRWERTGEAALRAAAAPVEGFVDLVLLDLGLPDLDGVEVCRRLRALAPVQLPGHRLAVAVRGSDRPLCPNCGVIGSVGVIGAAPGRRIPPRCWRGAAG